MSIATTNQSEAASFATDALSTAPRVKRWTADEYRRLIELGVFEGQRVELIEGEIIEHTSPQSEPHILTVHLAARALTRVFDPARYYMRLQSSLPIGQTTTPQPDIAVIQCDPRDFARAPVRATFVLEVAVSSGPLDRCAKSRLYATAGIPEYWIIDVEARTLEVRRDPGPDPDAPDRARYATMFLVAPGQTVTTLAEPQHPIDPAELLP